jgi:hypothetical protein
VSRSAKLLAISRRLIPTVDQRGPRCFAPSSEVMGPRFARSRSGWRTKFFHRPQSPWRIKSLRAALMRQRRPLSSPSTF